MAHAPQARAINLARVNGRQRLAQVHRRQAQHELVRARIEGATVAQPQPDMAQRPPRGRSSCISTDVFGTPSISRIVKSGAQS